MMKHVLILGAVAAMSITMTACKSSEVAAVETKAPVFYVDNKFDGEAGKQAYFAMMEKLGAPVYKRYKEEPGFFWAVDFAQGDFETLGMGGVFWVNRLKEGYFAHEIFLLPGQSIAEHCHMITTAEGQVVQPKHESWQVRYGSVYGFSEVGEANLDRYPEIKERLSEAQLKHLKSFHVEKWEADGTVHPLPEIKTWHFMMGGPEGAVVSEYATFHDNSGLRFALPGVAF